MSTLNNTSSIAYLGEQFSFHHLAAIAFFGKDNTFVSAQTFDNLMEQVDSGNCDFGILAVENTLAGDVPGNFALLANHKLEICGEIILKIQLHLGALPGANIENIHTVYSHKMAIKETTRFFSAYPQIRTIETTSTSNAVKLVAESGELQKAAIASTSAIAHFNLEVIVGNIDNSADNETRFLIFSNKSPINRTTNLNVKASLLLKSTEKDSALQLLRAILDTKDTPFNRVVGENVYLETGVINNSQIDNIILKMQENQVDTRILGVYPPGVKVMG